MKRLLPFAIPSLWIITACLMAFDLWRMNHRGPSLTHTRYRWKTIYVTNTVWVANGGETVPQNPTNYFGDVCVSNWFMTNAISYTYITNL